ncbi:hypothetical protein C7474_0433 [Microbacterium telephonicum]|uniref:Uncharacterized protein n=2 Tax=Microbacterium telephonicum TaxID=1714841 RepID=A0A498CAG3_9MICO|nr:hypothetical protein C7474_0433 [Microbacterium telephonicum]
MTQALQAAAFTSDTAEAEWFVQALSERGDVLDHDDADRVIAFVFVWILGFEAAASTWVSDRQLRAALAARMVRDNRNTEASIDACTDISVSERSAEATFRIANVPSESDYPVWSIQLQSVLRETASGSWWVKNDGTVTVNRPREQLEDLEGDFVTLTDALALAEKRMLEEAVHERERRIVTATRKAELDAEVGALRDDWPDWVARISWSNARTSGSEERWIVTLTPEASRVRIDRADAPSAKKTVSVADLIRGHARIEQCYGIGSSSEIGIEPVMPAGSLISILQDLDHDVAASIKFEAERATQAENQRQATLNRINSLIGDQKVR